MPAPLESLLTAQGPILGLALLRAAGLTLALPWIGQLPVRARIGLAIILGVALSGFSDSTAAVWSIGGALSELLTGLSLGIGLRVIMSALTAAGTWIDEQTTTGLTSEPLLDEADDSGSGTAKILAWLGAWFILTTAPGGGDLAVMERGIQSLTEIPLGSVISPGQLPEWIVGLLRVGSELAVGVAIPVCLIAALVQGGLALLGRGLGVGIAPALSPMRALLSCGLLLVVLPWQAERIDQALEQSITLPTPEVSP